MNREATKAIGRVVVIRVPDREPHQDERWVCEVQAAKSQVAEWCAANGREIDKLTVSGPHRSHGLIPGDTFKGLEGTVRATFKPETSNVKAR